MTPARQQILTMNVEWFSVSNSTGIGRVFTTQLGTSGDGPGSLSVVTNAAAAA